MDITVPRWGLTMDDALLAQWLKQQGDSVLAGEPIAILEADKIEGEIESPGDGTLIEVIVEAGTTVEPGQVIARLEPQP